MYEGGEEDGREPRVPSNSAVVNMYLCCMHPSVSFQIKHAWSTDRPPPLGPWSHVHVLLVQLVQLAPEQTQATTGRARWLRSMAEFTREQNAIRTHGVKLKLPARTREAQRLHVTPWPPSPIENTESTHEVVCNRTLDVRVTSSLSAGLYRQNEARKARSVLLKET